MALTLCATPAHADDLRNKPGETRKVTSGETLTPPEVKPGLAGSFLASRFAKNHQDLQAAAANIKDTLAKDPSNIRLQHEAMRMSLLAGNVADAIGYAKKLQDEATTDALVATLLMLDNVKAGQYDAASKLVDGAPAGGLYGIVRPVISQWLGIAAGSVKQVDMQATIDKAGFFAPFITYHVALMDDVLGNTKAAQEFYTKASYDAGATPYRVVEAVANFYERQGNWAAAQKAFDDYANANPDSSLLPDKLNPSDTKPAPLVANGREGLAELFFTTASILFGEDSTQDTFLYLRVALDLKPDLPPAQLMLANLYEQVQDYKQAIAIYDGMAKDNVFYRRGQVRKALNMEALGQRGDAIASLDKLSKQYTSDTLSVITKGDMLREDKRYDEAADAYSEAIARSQPLKGSEWPLFYARGISYERAGNWDKAEADFKKALELQPDQPDVLNYLAYSWLTMNKNIPQAKQYLETALAARPDDAHIIDSMGEAQYLTGDFATAVTSFEKAVDLMPEDPTVNEHLGDAYYRAGRQTEAQFQWNRALTFKPDDATVTGIKNKLANGMPPFMPAQPSAATPQSQAAEPAPATVASAPPPAPFAKQVR